MCDHRPTRACFYLLGILLLCGLTFWHLPALWQGNRNASSTAMQSGVVYAQDSEPTDGTDTTVFLPLIANEAGQRAALSPQATPEKAFVQEIQALATLLASWAEMLAVDTDLSVLRAALATEKVRLLALDTEIRANFAIQEEKLRAAALPALILQRHTDGVRAHEEAWQQLLDELTALDNAQTANQLQEAIGRTQAFLQQSQPAPVAQLPNEEDLATRQAQNKPIPLTFATELPTVGAAATQAGLSVPGNPPDATDLLPTIDLPLNQEIIDLAATLDNAPLQIYQYVKNTIAYEPYLGSRKGALETLHLQEGNDYDQASLLIALLRAAGFPARYVAGRALLPAAQINGWLGVDDVNAAGSLLGLAGLGVIGYNMPNGGQAIEFNHVWVAAYLPYTNYRGAPEDASDAQWIPLDPSIKTLEVRPGVDIPEAMDFDAAAFVDSYISTFHTLSPVELYLQQIETYVATNYPSLTYPDDIIRQRIIQPDPLPMLPASLPYLITSQSADYAEIPANKRYRIGFELLDEDDLTLFTYTADLPTIAGKRITLSYLPATAADQAVVDLYGDLYATPPSLLNLQPVLKIDGVIVVQGPAVVPGAYHTGKHYFYRPTGDNLGVSSTSHLITAGEYQGIAFDTYRMRLGALTPTNSGSTPDTDGLLGEQLYRTAMAYLDRQGQSWELTADTMQVVNATSVAQAIATNDVAVYYWGGGVVGWEARSLTIDAQNKTVGGAFSVTDGTSDLSFMILTGAEGSTLENRLFEDLYGQEAVSTIKVLELAADADIPICVMTAGNVGACSTMNQSALLIGTMNLALTLGYEVVAPKDALTYHDWHGGGFIARNPVTKEGYWYIVEGGLNGGMTVDNLIAWTNDLSYILLLPLAHLCTDEPEVTAEFISPPSPLENSYWPRQKGWLSTLALLQPWNIGRVQPVFETEYTICFALIDGSKLYPKVTWWHAPSVPYPVGEHTFSAGAGTGITRTFTIFDVIVDTPEGVYAPVNGDALQLEARVIPEMPPDAALVWEQSGVGTGNYSAPLAAMTTVTGTTTGNMVTKVTVTNPNGSVSDEQDLTVFGVKVLDGSDAFMGKGYNANLPDFPDAAPPDPAQILYYIDAPNHPEQGLFIAQQVTMTVSSGNVLTHTTPLSMSLPGNRNTTWDGTNLDADFVPAGLYQSRIMVEAPNGKTAVSDPYDIAVVEVTSVEFFDLAGNAIACPPVVPPAAPAAACNQHPTHPGGVRIFPGSLVAGQPRNNKIRVRATLNTAVPITSALPIYFKSYDVNDPTGLIDDNNNDLTVSIPLNGEVDTGISDGDNTVEVDFVVTMHPGDNFKVFASTNQLLLQNLSDAYVENAIDPTGATTVPLLQPLSSERLTIWRYVHVERDSMTAVANALPGEENFVQGNITAIDQAAQQAHVDIVLRDGSDDLDSAIPRNGRFENGVLTTGGVAFPILGNGIDYLRYNNLQIPYAILDSGGGNNGNGDILNMTPNGGNTDLVVTGPLVPNLYVSGTITIAGTNYGVAQNLTDTVSVTGSIQISFTLVDDDAIVDPGPPDTSHVVAGVDNRFAYAYVEAWIHDDNADVSFVRNTGITNVELIAGYDFDMKPTVENGDYWIVYLLGGFQFVELQDRDPLHEGVAWGYADSIGSGDGAIIAMETYRDSPPNDPAVPGYGEPSTVAHEIGHLFGGDHDQDGIMCGFTEHHGGICRKFTEFGDATLIFIRTIVHP